MLKYLWCERDHLHVHRAQLSCDGSEDAASPKLSGIVEEYACVVVESDVRTISPAHLFLGAYDESF